MRQRAAASVFSGEQELSMRTILVRVDFRGLHLTVSGRTVRHRTRSENQHGWLHDFVPLGGISWVF